MPRGKMLGGSGGINVMLYLRGFPKDYDTWEELGNEGWNYQSVKDIFDQMENHHGIMRKNGDASHSNGPIKLNYFSLEDSLADTLIDGLKEQGYPWVEDFNDGVSNIGVSSPHGNFGDGVRQSSARAYLIPAAGRDNLHVVKNAQVTKLDIKDDLVQAVEFIKDGREYSVSSRKEVILSAGSFGTPQILLLSGIGPKDHLKSVGINLERDLPVGKNLQDHINVPMHFKFSKHVEGKPPQATLDKVYLYLLNRTGPLSVPAFCLNGFLNTDEVEADHPNIQTLLGVFPKGSRETIQSYYGARRYKQNIIDQMIAHNNHMKITEMLIILPNPESRGEIKLRDDSPQSKPLIYPNYLDEEKDVQTIVKALKIYNALGNTEAFRAAGGEFIQFDGIACKNYPSDEYWECYARHFSTTLYHPVGTTKMGPNTDPEAVVDSKLRLTGMSNLRVCDAGIMPKIVSVNTNPASMMIGEKCAGFIKERFKGN